MTNGGVEPNHPSVSDALFFFDIANEPKHRMAINEDQMRRRAGVPFLILGIVIPLIWIASGRSVAHSWVIYVSGATFFAGGLLAFTKGRGPISELVGGIVCLLMSSLGFFAAFSPGRNEGSEIFFLSDAQNQMLGRIAFAMGAMLTMAFGCLFVWRSLWAIRNRE